MPKPASLTGCGVEWLFEVQKEEATDSLNRKALKTMLGWLDEGFMVVFDIEVGEDHIGWFNIQIKYRGMEYGSAKGIDFPDLVDTVNHQAFA